MSDDYYAPHPRLQLERPLVLVGHPGAGVQAVGRVLAGRTGLAFNDVARAVEARAGRSRARVLVEDGLPALRGREEEALRRALERRPCGVVTVESGPFEDAALRLHAKAAGRVLWLRRPPEVLLARMKRAVAESPGSLPEFLVALPARVEDLVEHLAGREAALRESDAIFEAGDLHASTIAAEILASLDRLLGIVAI